jgi:rod shape-determining protein MreD
MTDAAGVVRVALVLVMAALLQAGLVSWLNIGGYVPDLLLVMAIAGGAVLGPDRGALVGFASGLITDLMVTTPFGMWALVGCLCGAVAGSLRESAALRNGPRRALTFAAIGVGATFTFVVLARLTDQADLRPIDVSAAALLIGIVAGALSRPAMRAVAWASGVDHVPGLGRAA